MVTRREFVKVLLVTAAAVALGADEEPP